MTEVVFVEVTAIRMEMRAYEIAEHIYLAGTPLQVIAANQEQAARLSSAVT